MTFKIRNCRNLGAFVGALSLLLAGTGVSTAQTIGDSDITNAVENAFVRDQAVPFDRIDATTSDGIVTVEGKVGSVLAKRRAARLARTIKGVRGVVNRLEVKPAEDATAAELRERVEAALLTDPAADSYEIGVRTTDNGRVTLSGTVESWQERDLVERVAAGVKGVTRIDNAVTVDYEEDRPDAEIEPEIERALKWDVLVDASTIDVDVEDGTVRLRGTVGSAAERMQATAVAWVAGVDAVNNDELAVHDWAEKPYRRHARVTVKSDMALDRAVEDALLYDPRVNSFNVRTEVEGSTVTLRGKVDNLKAKRAAAEDARNTLGVARVVNRIKVRPVEDRSDKAIARDVRQTLRRDPYVERYEVDVSVVDGTVYLAGRVDSYFEKAQADDLASRVDGVETVSNALEVVDTRAALIYDPYVYDWYVYDYDWYDFDPIYTYMSDVEIADEINDEMWWSPFVDSDQVAVKVNDGIATLRGTVDSWSEYHAARENAYEGGASWVNNDLVVR